jgi:hypothetical protein
MTDELGGKNILRQKLAYYKEQNRRRQSRISVIVPCSALGILKS